MNALQDQLEGTKAAIKTLEINQDFHEQYFISKFMTENKCAYNDIELCRSTSMECGRLVTRFWVRKKE